MFCSKHLLFKQLFIKIIASKQGYVSCVLPQQIGHTREGGGGGVGLPQLYRSSNSRQICLQTAHLVKILLGKTWLSSESKVVFRHVIHALDLSCQEASTKWGVGHDANAQLPTSWYHFFLRQPEGWITSWMCGQPQTDRQAHRQTDITSTPGAIHVLRLDFQCRLGWQA